MKKIVIGIILGLVAGVAVGWLYFKEHKPEKSEGKPAERKVLFYRNPMNPQATSPVPMKDEMGMDYIPVYADEGEPGPRPGGNAVRIDPAFVQNMGVKTETVEKRILTRLIRASGVVAFDERKVYSINAKTMGWAEKLHVNYTGQFVKKGQPLMELYSPDLVSAEQEYLQTVRYLEQMKKTGTPDAADSAQKLLDSARKRLLLWDIPESEIRFLEKTGAVKKTMTIYSPDRGVVVEKMVLEGQQIEPGMTLYKIADLTKVWVLAPVYQYELAWVKTGAKAGVEISYLPGQALTGKITYIAPVIDERTKAAQVRVELENTPEFALKPGMFAIVKISSAMPEPVAAMPEQAVIHSGARDIAVVSLGNGYFEPRELTLGVSAGGYVEVKEGVSVGEMIVVSSQFLIDSESSLKAAVEQLKSNERPAADKPQNQEQPQPGHQH